MKAKSILRALTLAFVLCALLALTTLAADTAKIIRFDKNGNLLFNPAENVETGTRIINMPIETAYNSTAAQPEFVFDAANKFSLSEYPFVKIKMRTNFPETIQFYAGGWANTGNRADISTHGNIDNGAWQAVELAFTSDYFGKNYTSSSGALFTITGSAESVKTPFNNPFFQFKVMKNSPTGDLFAEIEYIAYFTTEAEMKAYGTGTVHDTIYVDGATIANSITSASSYVTTTSDDNLRIDANTTTKDDNNYYCVDVNFKDIFKNTSVSKIDLNEYPYVQVKFKNTYPGAVQMYFDPLVKNEFRFDFDKTTTVYKNGQWNTATFSLKETSVTDALGNVWHSNKVISQSFMISSIKIQVKTTDTNQTAFQNTCFEIDYIAFFKDKDAMANINPTNAVTTAIAAVEGANYSYMLHPALGEVAVENYVKNAVETANSGISAAANAVDFAYGKNSCDVKVTLSDGTVTASTTVTVALNYLDDITMTMLGAQLRPIEGQNGKADMRFGTTVEYNAEHYSNVSFGTLIIPKAYRTAGYTIEKVSTTGAVTTGTIVAVPGTTKCHKAVNVAASNFAIENGVASYNAVLTGIPTNYYATDIDARPYVTYTVGGREFTVYGETITRNLQSVIDAALEDGAWLK